MKRYVRLPVRRSLLIKLRTQTVRHVHMLEGVEISESKAQKDELILEGNDIDNVSQSGVLNLCV